MNKIMWQPDKKNMQQSHMNHFIDYVNQQYQQDIYDYSSLYLWSILQSEHFWEAVWNFCKVISSHPAEKILQKGRQMQDTKWFVGAKLNFAENLLQRRDQHAALIFANEQGEYHTYSYSHLYHTVTKLAHHLKELGVDAGDRVAAMLPNIPETVIAMLATTSLGAIWSSTSPDFGLQGLVDRFGQIKPKVLFAVDGHYYKGKSFNHVDKIKQLQTQLPQLQATIIIPYLTKKPNIDSLSDAHLWHDCLTSKHSSLAFAQLPFDHPLTILFSSGTTGKPKCMVHGAGGTLLQHLKELMLHTDLHPEQRIFFNTTCGWMMWNWLVSSLAIGATVVLYEGAPFYPSPPVLLDLIDKAKINIFGVGAKYLESLAKFNCQPKDTHSLHSLKTILTTGSPLLPETFSYVYQDIKPSVQLSSISGGSDIISCFALGNPLLPVYQGELQCIGLGMSVKIFNEQGHAVINKKGELVCTESFPSMPIYFWNDADEKKYQQAYFDKFPGVWAHGDYAEIIPHGGLIIYGRSDATLNPSGVRIGTAEIYQQLKQFNQITDALAIGQQWHGSERIILFVVLKNGHQLDQTLIKEVQHAIRENASPHHVPAKIIAAPDLPRTVNGKLVEIAVKKTMHGEPVDNIEALVNPESLQFFQNLSLM